MKDKIEVEVEPDQVYKFEFTYFISASFLLDEYGPYAGLRKLWKELNWN